MTTIEDNKAIKKRKRPSLVCESCKKKKIKCDKGQPCNQCIKSNITATCRYDSEGIAINNAAEQKSKALPYVASAKNPIPLFSRSNNAYKPIPRVEPLTSAQNRAKSINVSISEFNFLKQRLQQIEANMLNKEKSISPPQPNQTNEMEFPQPTNSFNMLPPTPTPVVSHLNSLGPQYSNPPPPPQTSTFRSSIQLPPLQFNRSLSPQSSTVSQQLSKSSPFETGIKSSIVSPGSALSIKLNNATDSSSLIGIHPYANGTDYINFFDDYTSIHIKEPSRRINFGPFAWSSAMKKDAGLSILWDYVSDKNDDKTMTATVFTQNEHEITAENTNVITTASSDGSELESTFKKRALETDGYGDILPYNAILKARVDKNRQRSKLNENALPLGLTFYDGQIDRELQLIEKIKIILPEKKVIWKLIKRYFTWLYPFMPFMDEECFTMKMNNIIGPESDEHVKVADVKIEKRLDLAYVGILLVILRLSYLTLFFNDNMKNESNLTTDDPSPKAQELKYLLSNPININTIDVAELCLDQFQLLRKTSFPIFQLAFYLRLYHLYAPEDGDGADGGDSQVLNAILIQMAYSLGLNRDPDNFSDVLNDKKINQTGRKMWHFLVLSDLYQGYTFGNPININPMSYDTKVPVYEKGAENISDVVLDKFVTESYFHCSKMNFHVRNILEMVLNVNQGANMAELCKSLDAFELMIDDQYGTLDDCLKPLGQQGLDHANVFTRNFRTKYYLSLKTFCITIYYNFYLYYERKNVELAYFYLKKILLISATDIMPHYFDLLGNSEIICDFIINPVLEHIIHKSNQFNLALIIRVNFIIYHLKNQPEHMAKMSYDSKYSLYYKDLCRYSSCLTRSAEISIAAVSKISNRYYYAWRITKGHTYLLKTVTSMQFYDDNYAKAGNLCVPLFTLEQMEEMIDICERMLLKLGKVKSNAHKFCDTFNPSPGDSSVKSDSPSTRYNSTSISTNGTNYKEKQNNISMENVDNAEIDKLWFQMLAMKYDVNKNYDENMTLQNTDGRRQSHNFPGLLPGSPSAGLNYGNASVSNVNSPFGPGGPEFPSFGADLDRLGFDAEQANQFDIFSELPFERVFNRSEN
ncbi:fungal transcriptional regulatory protein [Scheffersomyces coipomensis]|uniref:fungal transcriptional regulatory protein n=1 Tax=Scheffersomyces coipomensis TaxID=1788519 RepID=UPI00315CB2FC